MFVEYEDKEDIELVCMYCGAKDCNIIKINNIIYCLLCFSNF